MYDHSFRLDKPDQEEREYIQHAYGWADLEPKPMSEAAKNQARYRLGARKLWDERNALIEDWLDGKTEFLDRPMMDELAKAAEILEQLAADELQIVVIKRQAVRLAPEFQEAIR